MDEVLEFLKKCETYFLATMDGDQPRVRPFGTIEKFDGALYIQTGLSKNVAQQMIKNHRIEICGMFEGNWIRIAAEAELDERLEAQAHVLEAYPSLKGMYTAGDGNTAVFRLKNGVAGIYSFTDEPKKIEF